MYIVYFSLRKGKVERVENKYVLKLFILSVISTVYFPVRKKEKEGKICNWIFFEEIILSTIYIVYFSLRKGRRKKAKLNIFWNNYLINCLHSIFFFLESERKKELKLKIFKGLSYQLFTYSIFLSNCQKKKVIWKFCNYKTLFINRSYQNLRQPKIFTLLLYKNCDVAQECFLLINYIYSSKYFTKKKAIPIVLLSQFYWKKHRTIPVII